MSDQMRRFLSLDHLDHLLMPDEWDRLGLQNLTALRLEVLSEKEKIITADKSRSADEK